MRVAWVTKAGDDGGSAQAKVIAKHLDIVNFALFADTPLEIETSEPWISAEIADLPVPLRYPTRSVGEALREYAPDIVVFHSFSQSNYESIDDVNPFAVTVLRMGLNTTEQILVGGEKMRQLEPITEFMQKVDHVIAASRRTMAMAESYGVSRERIAPVPTAIGTERMTVPDVDVDPIVGCLGRVGVVKNQIVLVEALHLLRQRLDPRRKPRLWMAGKRNDELLDTMDRVATKLGLVNQDVRWLGHVDDPYAQYFDHIAVNALPSWTEHHPQSILEAAIAGVPSVISDLEWADQFGDWFPRADPDDPRAWANEFKGIVENDQYRRDLVEKQQDHVRDHYAAEDVCERYITLFEDWLDSTGTFKTRWRVRP